MVRFAVALLLLAGFAFADGAEARIFVRDGDPVTGTLVGLERVAVETAHGTVQLPVAELTELTFLDDGVRADARDGTFRGRLALERVRVKTRFGEVVVDTASMRSVTWKRDPAPPAASPAVVLADGTLARGRLAPAEVALDTAYGVLRIPFERIRDLRVADDGAHVRVGRDELKGTLPDRAWTLETRYGKLRFRTAALRRWTSLAPPREGDTLDGGYKVVAVGRFRGRTYVLVLHPEGVDWEGARAVADSLVGHLATIHDREENAFLLKLGRRGGRGTCWIGLSDAAEEGKWKWVTGEPATFSRWGHGEPNNAGGRENGAEMLLGNDDGVWNDVPLDQRQEGGCLIELER